MPIETWQGYRATLDSLLEGFQIIARDWTYLYVNPAAARHGRKRPDELVGRKMTDVYPGIEATPVFAALARCMLERVPSSLETQFTFPDATTQWFEVRIQPVPEGLCIHSVDIQQRKVAEAALHEQESIATLGRMVAVVAHEVKNPLAGLSGALQILKRRRQPGDPELQVFNEMVGAINSLDRLIRDLLIFARPLQPDLKPVAIDEVVRGALVLLGSDEAFTRHTVRHSVSEREAPIVRGDEELLKNVFRNLFLNAAQAMLDAGSIDVRIARAGALCQIAITDTGPGVRPEIAARLFEPFVTSKRGGTGLGLATSRRILRLHGGDLTWLPAPAGATFVASIPLHEE
jgi:PAS domain S-box-containing protein